MMVCDMIGGACRAGVMSDKGMLTRSGRSYSKAVGILHSQMCQYTGFLHCPFVQGFVHEFHYLC